MKSSALFVSVFLALAALSCSRSTTSSIPPLPSVQGPVIDAGSIPVNEARPVTLSNGAEIYIENRAGTLFYTVEGTFAQERYESLLRSAPRASGEERKAFLAREISKIFGDVRQLSGFAVRSMPEVGYFTFMMPYAPELLAPLKEVQEKHGLLLNPVVFDRDALRSVREFSPANDGLLRQAGGLSHTNFSGLEKIHEPEFVAQAQADIGGGVAVDGSSVNLGITDTGITFDHLTFRSSSNRESSRIVYMRDFTREGRVYFNPAAKFEVTAPAGASDDDLVVNAQIIVTPKLPSKPAGDSLVDIKDLKIKVSPALRARLTTPGSGAKLGVLTEDSLRSEDDLVDMNNNGKLDDRFFIILLPGATPAQDLLYVDFSGTGDFRDVEPVGDWNATRGTVRSFAERIGFDLLADELPSADGKGTVSVRSASVVGFDPGNHGSHVAGIAAGRQTIANDSAGTRARGVAPEAKVLMSRVCADNGGCNALEAFIDLATNAGAEVINMSLGGLNAFNDGYGVQETMINRLTSTRNVLFVISAGNSGPGRQTVGSPSVARLSLSVGAAASKGMIERQYQWPGAGASVSEPGQDEEFMLFFSSRGPNAGGGFKPSLAAPGTELSAVQLNAAPGHRAGMDVYWGTSMAAPTAAGAYALFLDAIKKYNLAHPTQPLTTDVLVLRQVLMATARPFDVSSFDPQTGERKLGQYTWLDQGAGMLDLLAAWKKLFELRDSGVASAVRAGELPVELDYQVLVPMKSPTGVAYDGTRVAAEKTPAFGSGIYLAFNGTDTLRPVHIARRLPESLAAGPRAGELEAQLRQTQDEFVLKTVIYGSDKVWLKAGVLDQLGCADAPASNLTVLGRGVEVKVNADGTGELNGFGASTLNVCIDRQVIAHELAPGDHGALISAYRIVDGKVAAIPSFVVPVSLTVPHRTLAQATAYDVSGSVKSFGVNRNYVFVPAGTSLVQVTLEVPAVKRDEAGHAVEPCSGVELMSLLGTNVTPAFRARKDARVSNCDANGSPIENAAKRKLVFSRANPTPGIWELHVFGTYKYAESKYRLRVDYITASTSVAKIEGGLGALVGELELSLREASMEVVPDARKSAFELTGLFNSVQAAVAKGATLDVESALGRKRVYPEGTVQVTVTTGGSAGNDLDLAILECSEGADGAESCKPVAQSGGATDEESASFVPVKGKYYLARVDGYEVKDEGKFVSNETIRLPADQGSVEIANGPGSSKVRYSLQAAQLGTSRIVTSELFTSGKCSATGALTLRSAENAVLAIVPVRVSQGK